ncbi:MAG: hypothetical protein KF886_19235 [Candidatus Hydrogenedentes bacterium]|nr:hypothetical protein [Candidatus Hydrogenedentota bacterium]
MRKLGVLALMLVVGTSLAFAGSISIPWFVDNAPVANFIPGVSSGVTGIVYLKSNVGTPLTCEIEYFSQSGVPLGPANNATLADTSNSFTIPPFAAVAFRPATHDPDTTPGGQESTLAITVPDRPATGVNSVLAQPGQDNDGKRNGSITISWTGDPTDVQGTFVYYQTFIPPSGDSRFPTTMSYGHLLPSGL